MSNVFLALPVPTGNGIGTPVDVSSLGGLKTIVVTGTATSTKNIEYNNDVAQGGSWTPAATVQNNGSQTVQIACRWMRVRVSGYNTSTGGTSAVNIGGTNAGSQFVSLPCPVGNGVGAAVDTSAIVGTFKTVQVGGPFAGTTIIEVSEDGATEWGQPFSFQTPGGSSAVLIAAFMRVRRGGVPVNNPGLPVVNVGFTAQSEGGGGGGSSIAIAGGTQTASSGTVTFSNGQGITFGLNNGVMTASVQTAGGTASGVGISAGTQMATSGVVAFSNGSGVSFGMASSSVITASVAAPVPQVPFAISAGSQSVSTGTLGFANSNGVSFGMAGSSQLTASFAPAASIAAISAGTRSVGSGTVVYSNSNGVSFGLSGQTLTASIAAAIPSVAISAAGSSIGAGTAVFSNANGMSFGMAASVVTASYQAIIALIAGASAVSSGGIRFADSNNVSFGLSGSIVTASAGGGGGGLTVLNQGTTIAGNPHTAVNFTGDGVSAADAGSGQATVLVPGGGTVPGQLFLGGILSPPPEVGGALNDYNPTGLATAAWLRMDISAIVSLTGIAAQRSGTVLWITSVGATTTGQLALLSENAASVAANRLLMPSGMDWFLPPGNSVCFIYDGVSSRWRVLGFANQSFPQNDVATGGPTLYIGNPNNRRGFADVSGSLALLSSNNDPQMLVNNGGVSIVNTLILPATSGPSNFELGGNWEITGIVNTTISADQDNWNVFGTNGNGVRVNQTGSIGFNITGLAGGIEGMIRLISNGSLALTLLNQNSGSSVGNQFLLPTPTIVIPPFGSQKVYFNSFFSPAGAWMVY